MRNAIRPRQERERGKIGPRDELKRYLEGPLGEGIIDVVSSTCHLTCRDLDGGGDDGVDGGPSLWHRQHVVRVVQCAEMVVLLMVVCQVWVVVIDTVTDTRCTCCHAIVVFVNKVKT